MRTKFNGILTLFFALIVHISFAQEKTITGTVSDQSGVLPGVSIAVKGTGSGAETDFNGKYTIQTNAGDVLVFRYLGYKEVEKTVGEALVINVTLKEDANVLDEIVVVGGIAVVGRIVVADAAAVGIVDVVDCCLERKTCHRCCYRESDITDC